jgi:hypothetical protein
MRRWSSFRRLSYNTIRKALALIVCCFQPDLPELHDLQHHGGGDNIPIAASEMAESMGFNSSRRGYEVRVPTEVVYNHSHNSNATHAWVHGEIVLEYVDPNSRVNTLVVDLGGGDTIF